MMHKLKSLVIPLVLVSLLSCDNVEIPGADITFPVTLTKKLPVTAADTNENTFTTTIDASSDSEVKKNLSKIKGYEITELLFGIENYSSALEDEIYFNGTIGFSKVNASQASSTCALNNIPITHWAGTQDFPIGTCDDLLNEISKVFTEEHAVKIYMTGTFTKAPLSFDLKITVKAKITVSP